MQINCKEQDMLVGQMHPEMILISESIDGLE